MWVARAVAKGRGRHVLGHPEHTAEAPSRLRQPTAGAVLAAAHGDEPGVDTKSALNANHTASRTKLASHARRANDVPVNFS
jgi:hypothetical protein